MVSETAQTLRREAGDLEPGPLLDAALAIDTASLCANCIASGDPLFSFPPLVMMLYRLASSDIAWLNSALIEVTKSASIEKKIDLLQFLRTRAHGDIGNHSGRVFDVATRLRVVRAKIPAQFDVPVPGGTRDVDIVVSIDGAEIAVECKALTESDHERDSFTGLASMPSFQGVDIESGSRRILWAIMSKLLAPSQLFGWQRSALLLSISMTTGASVLSTSSTAVDRAFTELRRHKLRDFNGFSGTFLFDNTRYVRWIPNPDVSEPHALTASQVDALERGFRTRLPIEEAINGYQG